MKRAVLPGALVSATFLLVASVARVPGTLLGAESAGRIVFEDTFTVDEKVPCEGCTDELAASGHVPERGAGWKLNEDTSDGTGRFKVASYRDWLSPYASPSGVRVSYYADTGTTHSPNYALQFQLDNAAKGSAKSFVFAMLRRTQADTFYGAGWYAPAVDSDCYLFKMVRGNYTQLANADCNFFGDDGTGDQVRFEVVGSVLTLYRNGQPALSARDNELTQTGYAGLGMGNIRPSAREDRVDSGFAADDFLVFETPVAGISPVPSPVAGTSPAPAPQPIAGAAPVPSHSDPAAPAPLHPAPIATVPPPSTTTPPASVTPSPTVPIAAIASGDFGYFNSLVARPDHWKSYSLRDPAQLALYQHGDQVDVTYSPATDTYPTPQDAAKVVVPEYRWLGPVLGRALSASDTLMLVQGIKTGPQVTYKIDDEIIAWAAKTTTGEIKVIRGASGTKAAPHAANAPVLIGSNSLMGQIRLPMGTEEGHSYFTTWDAWYGPEIRNDISGLTGWKTFQFAQGTDDGSIGLEVRNRFTYRDLNLAPDEISEVDMRAYVALGPGVANEPLRPMANRFNVKAATWTRYWVLLEHVRGDWDRLSLWVADETRGPVQIHDRIPYESASRTIAKFWLEFNTSLDVVKANRGPLVTYVRNVVVLQDVNNPASLLQRPTRSASVSRRAAGIAAPSNVRVVR